MDKRTFSLLGALACLLSTLPCCVLLEMFLKKVFLCLATYSYSDHAGCGLQYTELCHGLISSNNKFAPHGASLQQNFSIVARVLKHLTACGFCRYCQPPTLMSCQGSASSSLLSMTVDTSPPVSRSQPTLTARATPRHLFSAWTMAVQQTSLAHSHPTARCRQRLRLPALHKDSKWV